ncbi:MAG TPA: hypothetical protein VKM54_16060, partial [Myxococcota bacterium]|nr:hypothetical protein [Myxococcota bacterium]
MQAALGIKEALFSDDPFSLVASGLVERAQDWRWSSLLHDAKGPALDPGPVPRGPDWLEFVSTPMTDAEVA